MLGRFPDNLEALQELVDLHREKGENEAAAQRLRVMAEVHRLKGDPDKAARSTREADSLAGPPGARIRAGARACARAAPAPAPQPAPTPAPPRTDAAPRAAAPPAADLGVEITVEEPARAEERCSTSRRLLEPAPPEPEPQAAFEEDDLAPAGGDIGGQFIDEEEPPAADGGFDLGEPASAPAPS